LATSVPGALIGMGVMVVTDQVATSVIVRRMVFCTALGALIGYGLSQLPDPVNVIAVLAFAGFGILYCLWQVVDIRRRIRHLDELRAEAEAYLKTYDRHPRPRT
jgi:hypothetical protein